MLAAILFQLGMAGGGEEVVEIDHCDGSIGVVECNGYDGDIGVAECDGYEGGIGVIAHNYDDLETVACCEDDEPPVVIGDPTSSSPSRQRNNFPTRIFRPVLFRSSPNPITSVGGSDPFIIADPGSLAGTNPIVQRNNNIPIRRIVGTGHNTPDPPTTNTGLTMAEP